MAEPHLTTKELPPELLLFHILPRLPAKSIPHVMCVCKQWRLFLSTPQFAKMHLHHLTNDDHHKHLVFSTKEEHSFRTMDCETPKDSLTASRSFPFNASSKNMSILSSLHGLLCVGIPMPFHGLKYSDLILWNPLTGDYKTLPKAVSQRNCYYIGAGSFGLYYSSSEDDYKLLRICVSLNEHPNVYIYSLKFDSWRTVEQDFRLSFGWMSDHVLLNEKLYFLNHVSSNFTPISSYSSSIVRFDTKTESLTEITTPCFGNLEWLKSSMMVLRGCIHLCVSVFDFDYIDETIELWRMDRDGGEWTKVVMYRPKSVTCSHQPILHIMRNGNWLYHDISGERVYQLDIKKQIKGMVVLSGKIYFPRKGKYIETMVSPNQYMK